MIPLKTSGLGQRGKDQVRLKYGENPIQLFDLRLYQMQQTVNV